MTDMDCPKCGTHIGAGMLACPSCASLVHTTRLTRLAGEAGEAESAHDIPKAIALWTHALTLLPAGAGQRTAIQQQITRLEAVRNPTVDDTAEIQRRSGAWKKWLGGLAPAVALLLTKGKFILLGLTKLPTLASMLVFISVYWQTWGWAFALGLALSIYIHEMGHMLMFRRYGIASSNPLFLPGFGAIIFAKQKITDPRQDAHIGLGGPAAGLVAALVCLALYGITRNELFLALTTLGALINLFNLIPILFLDGSHAMRGLVVQQRWGIASIAVVCAIVFSSKIAIGIALVLVGRILFWKKQEAEVVADRPTFLAFAALLVSLSGLAAIRSPSPEQLRTRLQQRTEAAALPAKNSHTLPRAYRRQNVAQRNTALASSGS
jgi:Zn-dependent protease